MGEEMTFEVSDEATAREVAFGILGRANQIHENPDDEYEETALELRSLGNQLLEEYRNQ